MGLATPFLASLLTSCEEESDIFKDLEVNFSGKVLIIGAGAAGMTAGHILNKYNIDFEILEASGIHGGRLKKSTAIGDLPLDMGAEWIHTNPRILSSILNDPASSLNVETVIYKPETIYLYQNGNMTKLNAGNNLYQEWKFKNSTWYDFFDQNMVANFSSRVVYNAPVTRIDYSGARVNVTTADATVYEADKVLVAVPISILKESLIEFTPALPSAKSTALENVEMPAGFKASIEFSEKFYPDLLGTSWEGLAGGQNPELFIDGVYRKDSNHNIMNLFTVEDPAIAYSELNDEAAQLALILGKLDEMFDGKASETYLGHVIQDWTNEPYIRGSYSFYGENEFETITTLAEPIENKVYFAGEAYSVEQYSTVHGAAESAYTALALMLEA